MTIQFSLSLLKPQTQIPLDMTLRAVTHQIEVQKYTLVSVHTDHVILKSNEDKQMNLTVYKNKLQLSASGAGQIIMAQNISQLTVFDRTTYLELEVVNCQGQKANCLLYLKKGGNHN
ncbi:hypothetical protein [Leuconostoc gelidum]|nr:hypothetical protein [Leuconostoc gelidum]